MISPAELNAISGSNPTAGMSHDQCRSSRGSDNKEFSSIAPMLRLRANARKVRSDYEPLLPSEPRDPRPATADLPN
jgi:hypothetical protein